MACGVTIEHVGVERSPVIRLDDFAADPHELVTLALDAPFIDAGSVYPGVRAPAPARYVEELLARTSTLIERAFGAPPAADLDLCAFSIVTKPAGALRAIQRIPHFDGPDPGRIAFVHYLCGAGQGGTSFYRHRATGLEIVTPEAVEDYRRTVAAELAAAPPEARYIVDDNPRFEHLHRVGAEFNRLVIYRGNALHSGDIGDGTVLSEDPRRGRLTVNGFGFLAARD